MPKSMAIRPSVPSFRCPPVRILSIPTDDAYDDAWLALNRELTRLEEGPGGLASALDALEVHQRRSGFIQDDLSAVSRHRFEKPGEPGTFFSVQFNPRRRKRFGGAGRAPSPEAPLVHGGCFLCRDNIRWLQEGRELGFTLGRDGELRNGQDYIAWMNPFPLLPSHLVLAASVHRPQNWSLLNLPEENDGSIPIRQLIFDLTRFGAALPDHIGFYNGVDAGASIPHHLHFQFSRRPADLPLLPLEARARPIASHEGQFRIETYPLPVMVWRGAPDSVAREACGWITEWAQRHRRHIPRLSGNLIVSGAGTGDGHILLYFVPRDRAHPRWAEDSGPAGGLEVLGELVFSSDEEQSLLQAGAVDYAFIERALGMLATKFE